MSYEEYVARAVIILDRWEQKGWIKMNMLSDKYYFAYYRRLGIVYCMRWHEDIPLIDNPIEGTKVEITEQEFDAPLSLLEARYPFKE